MVGGTFGVAVTGAMLTAIGKSKINQGLPHLPAASRSALANALCAGGAPGHGSAHVVAVVRDAFVSALGVGLTIGAAVTLVGAVLAFTLVQPLTPAHRTAGAEHDAAAAADAEAAAEAGAEAELTLV
jgi:hypothetical protein